MMKRMKNKGFSSIYEIHKIRRQHTGHLYKIKGVGLVVNMSAFISTESLLEIWDVLQLTVIIFSYLGEKNDCHVHYCKMRI